MGFRYALATGGGLDLVFPATGERGPEGGYHLMLGAAPSVTNAGSHGFVAPFATGSFGFEW